MEVLIEVRGLTFGYPDEDLLFDRLHFRLFRHQKVAILGDNGTGKTTFFHLLMGLLKPIEGEIVIFQKPRQKEKDFLEVRQNIGMLFQDPDDQLFCPTVEEDIAFGPLNLGKSQHEAKETVKDVCKSLGIEHLAHKLTSRLSAGQKRIVSLATVLAMKPVCYLLDEPTNGLDDKSMTKFIDIFHKSIDTAIVISHDVGFLKKTVDVIYELRDKALYKLF